MNPLQGTTSNGRYLLPFKTGAFLAGVPVLPTIIHYHTSSGANDLCCSSAARALAAAAVAAAAAAAAGLAASNGAGSGAAAAAGLAAAGVAAVLGGSALMGVGGVSPTWESIDATRHLLLMMCQPFHTVTCYEVGSRSRLQLQVVEVFLQAAWCSSISGRRNCSRVHACGDSK
jgi:hypothetical protein